EAADVVGGAAFEEHEVAGAEAGAKEVGGVAQGYEGVGIFGGHAGGDGALGGELRIVAEEDGGIGDRGDLPAEAGGALAALRGVVGHIADDDDFARGAGAAETLEGAVEGRDGAVLV